MKSFGQYLKKAFMPDGSDMLFWAAVFAVFQTAMYFFGAIIFGTVKNYDLSVGSLAAAFAGLAAAILITSARELLRWAVIRFVRSGGFAFIFGTVTAIGFAAADLAVYFAFYHGQIGFYKLISGNAADALAFSCVLTLMSFHSNVLPCFVYSLTAQAAVMLLPFRSAMNSRMSALITAILCMMFIIVIDCAFSEEKEPEKKKRRSGAAAAAVCGVSVIAAAFFTGILPLTPVSIATGSMQPEYSIGDMVIVRKGAENIEIGDVIQFNCDSHTVVHRVVDIVDENGTEAYITRGDANNANDSGEVTSDEIIGKVVARIPYAGRLSLWLR